MTERRWIDDSTTRALDRLGQQAIERTVNAAARYEWDRVERWAALTFRLADVARDVAFESDDDRADA